MTIFKELKNTLLFLFLVTLISPVSIVLAQDYTYREIQPAANHTELYLPLLQGKKAGIVANQTSVLYPQAEQSHYTHLVDTLAALQVNLVKVFAPEHGFRGEADAGEKVSDGKDSRTGLPLISLYGKNKKPSREQLSDLDLVIFDIQDVGVRFYTYISTLHYVMEACAEQGIPLIVLDRPNPNDDIIDGPTLDIANQSFLGMHPIPLMHGMTIGEYARMINGEKWLKNGVQCELTVIPMKNYQRGANYAIPVRPSPNLPNDQSIRLYPSLGLFEGTNINAGRGTEFQFQRYGAPYLDPSFFSFSYTPKPNFGSKNPKHEGTLCHGEDLSSVTVEKGVNLSWIIKAYTHCLDKSKFFNTDSFTKHAGTSNLQQQIEKGVSQEAIEASWKTGIENFRVKRQPYLLY